MENFEVHAKALLSLSNAEEVVYAPKVLAGQRDEWEAYAWENQGWFNYSVDIYRQDAPDWMRSINITADPIPPKIYNSMTDLPIDRDATEPSFPVWSYSPPVHTDFINLDIAAPPFNQGYDTMERMRGTCILSTSFLKSISVFQLT
jgi:hypothetical protein